jgi:hypothetical protein
MILKDCPGGVPGASALWPPQTGTEELGGDEVDRVEVAQH